MRALVLAVHGVVGVSAVGEDDRNQEPDNGTDPTRLSRQAAVQFEHLDLTDGFDSDTLLLSYTQPFGSKKNFSIRVRLPFTSVNVVDDESYDVGDLQVKLTKVTKPSASYGVVLQGELAFDTADRPELGSDRTMFKGTAIYAKFLDEGHIFAPGIVHSISVAGDDGRGDVNNTVFDFYYVPRLANPKYLATFDPALNVDWERDLEYLSFAVTVGRLMGSSFGGNGQLFVKPSIFVGGERPRGWGIEVGYKLIGF